MQSSSPYDSMNTTTAATTTVPFVSLYPFQGDRSKNQLSFPPHTLIDVDPTKQPSTGWIYGGYYHYHNESTAQFIKGWFPSSYVQRCQPPLSSSSSRPPATREQTQSRPRFNETIDANLNNQNFNSSWPSNNNAQQQQQQQQVQRAEDMVMNNIDLYHRHDTGIPAEGFDSSSSAMMGGSTSIPSSRQLYRIDETGDCSDDVKQVTRNKMTSGQKTNNDCEQENSSSSSSNGFDVATNNIMGGNLPRSNNEGRTNERDDGWGDSNDNNNDDKSKNDNLKTKLGGWFNQSFTLLPKNKRKVQPMTMMTMVSPSRKKAAKEPEWNAEPQIILPDGSIIEEYPTKKHGFLSFSQQFHGK